MELFPEGCWTKFHIDDQTYRSKARIFTFSRGSGYFSLDFVDPAANDGFSYQIQLESVFRGVLVNFDSNNDSPSEIVCR